MSEAREAILGSIRTALKRGPLSQPERQQLESQIATPPHHTRPHFGDDLARRFAAKLESRAATVVAVSRMADASGAVVDYLDRLGLPKAVAAAPALENLEWPQGLAVRFGRAETSDQVSVTPCFAGVAETGSLVLLSGPSSPTTLNFVPENHVVIVRAARIVRHFEDAWDLLRKEAGGIPRTVNVISGPSRTADVEQTIQLGAHGPRRLHVVVVNG
ncbi:MAG: lactate utilization protein [Betaproteobacteria bacterium]|nr:lactate utilization protein [Betaproteobacteria bacterium]